MLFFVSISLDSSDKNKKILSAIKVVSFLHTDTFNSFLYLLQEFPYLLFIDYKSESQNPHTFNNSYYIDLWLSRKFCVNRCHL